MPRRPRFAQSGYVFHVLNRGASRQKLFETERDYDAFIGLLAQAQHRVSMRILAYCLMQNHWHLVLWPENDDTLSEFMRWLTVTHSQRWHAHRGTAGTGPVYQGRFKSFPVQADEHFLAVCRYVERNALRANLCSRAELWKWSSAWTYSDSSCPVTLTDWPLSKPSAWLAYVNEPQTEGELAGIRHSVIHGKPYGSTEWTRQTATTLGLQRLPTPSRLFVHGCIEIISHPVRQVFGAARLAGPTRFLSLDEHGDRRAVLSNRHLIAWMQRQNQLGKTSLCFS